MPLPDALLAVGAARGCRSRAIRSTSPSVRTARSCRSSQDVPPSGCSSTTTSTSPRSPTGLDAACAEHARALIAERGLDAESLVVEIASNDGYLLRNFVERGIPVLGIDPRPSRRRAPARSACRRCTEFFDAELARRLRSEGRRADVDRGQQRDGAYADPEQLRRRALRSCSPTTAWRRSRTPTSGIWSTTASSTRSTTSTSATSRARAVDALVRRHGLFLNGVEHFPSIQGGTLRWRLGTRATPPTIGRASTSRRTPPGT